MSLLERCLYLTDVCCFRIDYIPYIYIPLRSRYILTCAINITNIKCRPYISPPVYKPMKNAYMNKYKPRAYIQKFIWYIDASILADIRYLLAVDFAIPSILATDKSWFVGMYIVYHHR